MASVPNMRLGAAVPANGAGTPAEGEGGDLFARLLSSAPILEGVPELSISPDAIPTGETPVASDQPIEGEEILLALTNGMAFQPVAIPAASGTPVQADHTAAEAAPTAPGTASQAAVANAVPTVSLPQPAVDAPVQPQAAVDRAAKPTQATIVEQPQIALAQAGPVVAKAAQAKPAATLVPPTVREAQAAAIAIPVADSKSVRPAERSKSAGAGASDKPAASLAAASAPLPFLTPTAILTAVAPDLAATAHSFTRELAQPQDVSQQLIEHELDLAQDGEWLDQLARDIARSGSSEGPMRFRLHPQTLGHLQVEVDQRDSGAAIRLTVETEAARSIIAEAQPRLIAEARAQGVRVAETHVDLAGARDHAAGEQRRHEDGRQNPTIRTARAPAGEADASTAEPPARSERYA